METPKKSHQMGNGVCVLVPSGTQKGSFWGDLGDFISDVNEIPQVAVNEAGRPCRASWPKAMNVRSVGGSGAGLKLFPVGEA